MKVLSPADFPALLSEQINQNRQQFTSTNPDYLAWFEQCVADKKFSEQLDRVWCGSQYAFDLCCRKPLLFRELVDSNNLKTTYTKASIQNNLSHRLVHTNNPKELDSQLRLNRNQEMLRIIWRDINRLADLEETTRDISLLAEASIQQALDFHHNNLVKLYGRPMAIINSISTEQKMMVIGMGKLGARELNLSSDIDLMFCYPRRGETDHKKNPQDNGEFFTRVARKLIQSIDQMTVDGFVFRVDMRLRPYGESGALVLSLGAMEEYYQDQGRDWERYAMIKARVIAGEAKTAGQLMNVLRPFTYRRYVDFSAFESLRSMKKMIQQEVKRRRLDNDVKLGPGGIRDIEFIAQCFQLIRGGRELELQERRVQTVLTVLAEQNTMPVKAVEELQAAYLFLRNTEHGIQAFNDQQTQTLPIDHLPQAALAMVLGFRQWPDFIAALTKHRNNVSKHFQQIIADDKEAVAMDKPSNWDTVWLADSDNDNDQVLAYLAEAGHEDGQAVLTQLQRLQKDRTVQRMQAVSRERLDQFIPLLLQAVANTASPSATLLRIVPLVESVLRRSAYLVLLVENPNALKQLVILCSASPWIAEKLATQPVLLDELLDTRTLYQVPEKDKLRAELQQHLLRVAWDDLEAHMDGLRYFKQAHQLHISAAEVIGKLPLMKVSDYLTMIAEVVLEHVLELAWSNLVAKHGRPQKSKGVACDKDFIIVGYGKLGGIELGHGSDLDLVFIHNAASGLSTDGDRPIDNGMFFTRLGQRMIHIMTAQTPSGMLYEVDMRLRPSGTSGLLVTSLSAFETYQKQDAWTWEHQALVRSRVVAGDKQLSQTFEALRVELLCQHRDEDQLKKQVGAMREKMRDHLLPKGLEQADPPIFHLKHGTGAIVDIEFMVQYAVLAWSHQHPALAVYTDNIRILEALQQQGLFSIAEAEALTEAYKAYRAHAHRLSLQQQPSEVPLADFARHRQAVVTLWLQVIGCRR
ncbi:MAG: bifunctional [glutamate--ammonia ligase]-adenylyl-L-tyrosine phosphorylase/[glutamate--ammonia-ligase] adenylyltransferase [Oceanicoccus sp.]|uniref:bifunctional [glutamate--ammonia ligase]-adenylyl-L-tyrosine phosphorylase/[glutamate--ammonia-ligase] adenylyltransferase n=1 Tax=Oceanicoccus sp. TaxID=2691044 RepID=UPI00261BD693|nr:bifunctional [glutamate--ammonia ligase]-adenylyl-L-tyrosine phosphorylase/[glutamate--ammonia-ligase] adenylyltransferase [Oceanicoccus sp.]MCP3908038.1 bifunctional [glutamate--ammonia ligase]-adenylyl-L-tyrosine phosphorylase/[glutamate--ammonia-ligase] adenylyltransferase [Oceanicoccus sp.]